MKVKFSYKKTVIKSQGANRAQIKKLCFLISFLVLTTELVVNSMNILELLTL